MCERACEMERTLQKKNPRQHTERGKKRETRNRLDETCGNVCFWGIIKEGGIVPALHRCSETWSAATLSGRTDN